MENDLNIGLIDTPLSSTRNTSRIKRWPDGPEPESLKYLSHADINVGLLLGQESIDATPILTGGNIYLAEAVQETSLALRLLEALEWMAEQPVKVVAMPFGEHQGSPFMIPMIQQLLDKDILPVAAIGNKGAGQFSAPGCYEGVLSVGGTDETGEVAVYSGSLNLPGGKCLKPEVLINGAVKAEQRLIQGTSFAATRLAGHLSILRNKHRGMTRQSLIHHVYTACTPIAAESNHRCVHGVLSLEKLYEPMHIGEETVTQALTIGGKFTDPNLLSLIKRYPADKMLDVIVCPRYPDLTAYPGVEVVRSFANGQIFAAQASVSTIRMMLTQPDILVLQSQEIPPISILQLQ